MAKNNMELDMMPMADMELELEALGVTPAQYAAMDARVQANTDAIGVLDGRVDEAEAEIGARYTKAETDGLIAVKADKSYVDNQDAALTTQLAEKANKTQEAWITPTFLNGATGTVKYMIDNFGFVHFRGRLLTISRGTPAFDLPAGYRLSLSTLFPVVGNIAGSLTHVNIGDGYQIKSAVDLAGGFYVDLSPISFKAGA